MSVTRSIALALLLALGACATQPPPDYFAPPPRKAPDAKTQLENGYSK